MMRKILYLTILLTVLVNFSLAQDSIRAKVVYVGDPMCGWCYGFTNELELIKELVHTYENVKLEMWIGGLSPYNDVVMDDQMKSDLREYWSQVEDLTDMPFTKDMLSKENFIYDTEPSDRAFVTARMLNDSMAYHYYRLLQQSFYQQGKDITSPKVLLSLAEQIGYDPVQFADLWNSDKAINATEDDFLKAQNAGVTTFPSVLVFPANSNKIYPVTFGYDVYANLKKPLEKAFKKSGIKE